MPDDQQLTELRSEARDEKDKVVQELEKAKIVAEPERAHGQRRKAPGVDQVLRVSRRRNPWLIRG